MSILTTAIWWHVYPLTATGAPIHNRGVSAPGNAPDAGHRFGHLENWLDYVIELGCSGVLLGPIFESVSHGYDTLDHFRIDPRLGDDADFDSFMEACRERGLLVMLDGVFNHVAATHPAVSDGLTTGEGWEGHENLATLNHADPRVADLVTNVMSHWLRRGIAGWRLDVAYSVPAEFWREVTGRVRDEFPDAIFLGEVIHGDYPAIASAGSLDTVTQYELWKAIWSSIKDENFWELAWNLDRHAEFSQSLILNTFVGNHDVDRVASLVGQDRAILPAALLMTLPGMPSIYYGDEQGFSGLRGEGFHADDAVRPPLPVTPAELLPFGWETYHEYQRLIALRRTHPWLSTGTVDIHKTLNEAITYSVSPREPGSAEPIIVDAWLRPSPGVHISSGDQALYRWDVHPTSN